MSKEITQLQLEINIIKNWPLSHYAGDKQKDLIELENELEQLKNAK